MMVRRNTTEHTNAVAAFLPNGRTFQAKNRGGSNLRQLLEGLAGEFKRAQDYIVTLEEEYLPDATTLYLNEWERAIGIPDSCFSGAGTLEERQRDILIKFAALGVQTAQDFIDLAALFGITVTVGSGSASVTFPLTFPVPFFDTATDARYTIVINYALSSASRFPLIFPIPFGASAAATLQCLFNRIKPANCQVIFNEV